MKHPKPTVDLVPSPAGQIGTASTARPRHHQRPELFGQRTASVGFSKSGAAWKVSSPVTASMAKAVWSTPRIAVRQITVTVSDGELASSPATRNIQIAAVIPSLSSSEDNRESSRSRTQQPSRDWDPSQNRQPIVFDSGQLFEQLDSLQEELEQQEQKDAVIQTLIAGSTAMVAGSLTVGYMIWILRVGSLMATMLSHLPAWVFVDPFPILDDFQDRESDAGESNEDSLATLVSRTS